MNTGVNKLSSTKALAPMVTPVKGSEATGILATLKNIPKFTFVYGEKLTLQLLSVPIFILVVPVAGSGEVPILTVLVAPVPTTPLPISIVCVPTLLPKVIAPVLDVPPIVIAPLV